MSQALKALPHNLEAEQYLIGAMMFDPACIPTITEKTFDKVNKV